MRNGLNDRQGVTNVNISEEMAAIDRLPPEARALVCNFALPVSAVSVEASIRKFGLQPTLEHSRTMLRQFRDSHIRLVWPPGHPGIGQPIKDDWT